MSTSRDFSANLASIFFLEWIELDNLQIERHCPFGFSQEKKSSTSHINVQIEYISRWNTRDIQILRP